MQDVLGEVFSTAWEIACGKDGEIDQAFWAHVRLLAEKCRSDEDFQGLLGVLLQISLSDRPPPFDREPIYRWNVDQRARHGLRPVRRKRADLQSTAASAERHRSSTMSRKEKRERLRLILDGGAPDATVLEKDDLARFVLDDAEARDHFFAEERELLAEEMQFAMRKLVKAANHWKAKAEGLELALEEAQEKKPEEEEIDFGIEEDVLRAAAGGGGAASVILSTEGAPTASAQGAGAGAGAGRAAPAGKAAPAAPAKELEAKASQLKRIDKHAENVELEPLSDLLLSDHEDVCVKAALQIAALCARDGERCGRLAEVGALPRIVALLDRDSFATRSLLDVMNSLQALAANRMHHPALLTQLVQANGPKRLVRLVGSSQPELARTALQMVRSLVDHKPCRGAFVSEAGVLPPLLRCLRPGMPTPSVEPAAAALAILVRFEPPCCAAVLEGGGLPLLVQLLSRGANSLAAHSACSAIASLTRDPLVGSDAQRRALEAKAVQETLPLLDGVLGGSAATAATASAACNCLGALCTGSSALAAELREMGALTSLVGLLASKVAPNGLKTNACEALAAAVENDATSCAELRRLGALPLLAILVKGATRKLGVAADAVLSALMQRGDEMLIAEIESSMRDAQDGAVLLVRQLQGDGRKPARRAALILDSLARTGDAARKQIIKLGAVPRLVKLMRLGHLDIGTLNAIGCLEVLAQNTPEAQDEARVAGVFEVLIDLIRPYDPERDLPERDRPKSTSAAASAPTTARAKKGSRVISSTARSVDDEAEGFADARWQKHQSQQSQRAEALKKIQQSEVQALSAAVAELAAEAPATAPLLSEAEVEEEAELRRQQAEDDAPSETPDALELRQNAALCLASLVKGNKASKEAAFKAGAVAALATLLDENAHHGADTPTEVSYLAAMALQALGLPDAGAQEKALKAASEGTRPGTPEHKRFAKSMPARVHTVKAVWKLEREPEHWGGGGGDAAATGDEGDQERADRRGARSRRRS